jgi:HPt (histidine-containing phosphotransfer) domain-containing protein
MAGRGQPLRVEVAAVRGGMQMTQRCDSDPTRERHLRISVVVDGHLSGNTARGCPLPPIIGGLGRGWRALKIRRHATWIFDRVSIETVGVPAIDMSAIRQLANNDDLGDQFVAEIIEVFLSDLTERVRTIGLQMSQNDRAGIASTAHAIKGSCGHFGALQLMELSRALEAQARSDQTDGLETAIDSMVAETERVRAALEAFRAPAAP